MIEVKNLTKNYKDSNVLENVNLTFPDNGFVFILGRSGSGKSTILNAVGGLISYEGQILYDGKQVDVDQYRQKNIGYVFQDFLLFDDLSVFENIKNALNIIGIYDDKEIQRRTSVLLKAVGLNINMRRSASALSLGQRQRVAIARTLASNPHVILADEPTGNLDSKNSILIMDILQRLSVNHLVICVTHNVNLVNRYADKALLLRNKKFEPIDPKTEELNEEYKPTSTFKIGKMDVKDFKDENLLIKLYSSPEDNKLPSQEIKIIKKDGKIVVVGDNVVLAQAKDIQLIKDEDENKAKEEKGEPSKIEALDLDFDNNTIENPKRSFKDTYFYQLVTGKLIKKNSTSKVRNTAHFFEVILPCIILILINVIFAVRDQFISMAGKQDQVSYENLVALVADVDKPSSIGKKLTASDVDAFISNPDTGIIQSPIRNNLDKASSLVGKYIYYGATKFDFITMENFTATKNADSFEGLDSKLVSSYCSDISVMKKVPSLSQALNQFDLKDDEIIIDKSALVGEGNGSSKMDDFGKLITVGNKPLKDCLKDTYFKMPIVSLPNKTEYKLYKIVGTVDLDSTMILANKKTADEFNINRGLYYLNNQNNIADRLPDFSDYLFVDYQTALTNADYSFPHAFVNDQPTKYSYVICSDSALNELTYNNNFDAYISKKNSISYVPDPSKKVICFVDYTDSEGVVVDSKKSFSSGVMGMNILTNLKTDYSSFSITSGVAPKDEYDVLLPSCYQDLVKVGDKFPAYYFTFKVCGFYSSTSYNDPICVNSNFIDCYLMGNYDYSTDIDVFPTLYGSNTVYDWISNSGNYFLTEDANKTINYFASHSELGLKAYTYDDVYQNTIVKSVMNSIKNILISIGVMAGIFLVISILDSFAQVNSDKYKYGVERCLGKYKKDIIKSALLKKATDSLFEVVVPMFLIYLFIKVFYLDFMGIWIMLLAVVGYVLVSLLFTLIPILMLLRKKPYDIIKSLS